MAHAGPTPMAWPMAHPIGVAECYETGRYETERENYQDPDEIPSVPDAVGAVDKGLIDRFEVAR